MKLKLPKEKPVKSKLPSLKGRACLVCYDKALVYLNNKEVKCTTCLSVYPLDWFLQKKG